MKNEIKVEIIVNVRPFITRVAVLENNKLVEIHFQSHEEDRLVGNIFKGTVTSTLPGIQAAFVELGLPKRGFLHISDFARSYNELQNLFGFELDEEDINELKKKGEVRQLPISELVKKGQEILVQVIKEPIGDKGPRLTTHISIAGRYLVLLPNVNIIGISRKIQDWSEKRMLKKLVKKYKPDNMGIILRTLASGIGESEIKSDIEYLTKEWNNILEKLKKSEKEKHVLLWKEQDMTLQLIRDILVDEVSRLVIDNEEEFKKIKNYIESIVPEMVDRVELYIGKAPIFDSFGVEDEIYNLTSNRVQLKHGGYIVIQKTEALVSIDVNTGSASAIGGKHNAILETNIEAAKEIGRQIRLRDLTGIIIIDFIDMPSNADKLRVLNELKKSLDRDKTRVKTYHKSELGLFEMTRQREHKNIFDIMTDSCPYCNASGFILSEEFTFLKLENWLLRACNNFSNTNIIIEINPEFNNFLNQKNSAYSLNKIYS